MNDIKNDKLYSGYTISIIVALSRDINGPKLCKYFGEQQF